MNRLHEEFSPYLKQHSDNPVHWWPWSEEAIAEAQNSGKLILLSVGYSTCHWCHVMKRESFENEQVAAELNENYIPIKVDREEKPDVDSVYMLATQMLSGQGGWPMTVWLTPKLEPIYAGTYFPAFDGERGVKYGFLTLLKRISTEYAENKEKVLESAQNIALHLREHFVNHSAEQIPTRSSCLERFLPSYDEVNGGVNGAPKFPGALPIELMLASGERHRTQALLTLDSISSSGIYDHVGGGIHRYAVDAEWDVPHFEKMLYDNALFLSSLFKADSSRYAKQLNETVHFLLEDMRDSVTGLFYSAIDAESEDLSGSSVEGFYYTWSLEEIKDTLTDEELQLIGLKHLDGREIIVHCPEELRQKLARKRASRPYPFVDKKVICSWNALVISALSAINPEEAIRSLDSLLDSCLVDSILYRIPQKELAHLEDYALLIKALIDVYQACFQKRYLSEAVKLCNKVDGLFLSDSGAYYSSQNSPASPPFREISCFDNTLPSANGVHAFSLLRLNALTEDNQYYNRVTDLLKAFAEELEKFPQASGAMSYALQAYRQEVARIRVSNKDFLGVAREAAGPFSVFIVEESISGAEVCLQNKCILTTNSKNELTECLSSL